MKNQAGNFQIGSTILPINKVHFIGDFGINNDVLNNLKNRIHFKGIEAFQTRLVVDYNTNFFFVGGCVRDLFLNKASKDIDIIVPHIDVDDLSSLLSIYGKVDLVGKSFGVIKFTPFGSTDTIDVSVPRIERSVGDKHTDFEIIAKTHITLEEDLQRRDFTINALAMSYNGYIFDPFEGIRDIKDKTIRVISETSFEDDPLRMLRALQFSARFGFTPTEETIQDICFHSPLINNISGERILIELEKGISGNIVGFANDLYQFGILTELFKHAHINDRRIVFSKTLAEFLFCCGIDVLEAVDKLKININQQKELKALYELEKTLVHSVNNTDAFKITFNALKICPDIINTEVFGSLFLYLQPFKSGEFPKSLKELEINGDDIMKTGLTGKNIALMQQVILGEIFIGNLKNKREDLLQFLFDTTKLIGNVKFD